MPADKPNIGTGRRRQGDTGPHRPDDSNRALERAMDEERSADDGYERGKTPGATGRDAPHRPLGPGSRRNLDDAEAPPPPER
jgi:hypothetical protein